MQGFGEEQNPLLTSGIIDPEQEEVDFLKQTRQGFKSPNSERELLSPWQVNLNRRPPSQQPLILEDVRMIGRPTMAQTDRVGRFKSIFDLDSLPKHRPSALRHVSSKIDNKWDGYVQPERDSIEKNERRERVAKKLQPPKPLKARMMQLATDGVTISPDSKRFRSPNKRSLKKHLVQHIDYKQIQDSMFKKPMTANRFDLLCRKLETRRLQYGSLEPYDKVKVINFPLGEKESAEDKDLKEYKYKQMYSNTFYLRNKLHKERRQSDSLLDCPIIEKPMDFREIINQQTEMKLLEMKKRKSRIFSMVLRI